MAAADLVDDFLGDGALLKCHQLVDRINIRVGLSMLDYQLRLLLDVVRIGELHSGLGIGKVITAGREMGIGGF